LGFLLLLTFLLGNKNLDQNEIARLATLGKIWGYLKYHHPALSEGRVDWDLALIHALKEFNQSRGKQPFQDVFNELIKHSGGDIPPCSDCAPRPEAGSMFAMTGHDWIEQSEFSEAFRDRLRRIGHAPRSSENYYLKLETRGNALYFVNENPYTNDLPKPEFRLLALFRFWNIIQYFYPYKYLIDEDWSRVLKEFIPKFSNAASTQDYHLSILELTTRINDAHAYASSPVLEKYFGTFPIPITLKTIDGQTVIYQVSPENSELKRGDIILEINGESIDTIRKRMAKYIPELNPERREYAINGYVILGHGKDVNLVVERGGHRLKTSVKRMDRTTWINTFLLPKNDLNSWRSINENVGYINMANYKLNDIEKSMNFLSEKEGIIFDLRNYPDFILYELCEYLLPDQKAFAMIVEPVVNFPGRFQIRSFPKVGPVRNDDYYKGRVVILVDETTISRAEFTLMTLQAAPNAVVIGSTTAGADGTVYTLPLPGGITVRFTGIGVYYPDGSQTQGVGITPDHEVKPTIEGLQNGVDEVFMYAVDFIQRGFLKN
jgi:C-terminal processing protease CtpA/Prc